MVIAMTTHAPEYRNHVVFENRGEIDPLLITTFGVNVKEGESAIGFFGTGLKYALAILTRLDIPIQIQTGTRVLKFGRAPIMLRGKSFEFVTMDGTPLGFTSEVGKKWKPWMAYRELYCNTLDECGRTYVSDEIPAPEAGITRVIVSGEAFHEIYLNHGEYFLQSQPVLTSRNVDIHPGASEKVFYRKVAVGKLSEKPCMNTYNFRIEVELTEDRTMASPYAVNAHIARAITDCDNREIIRSAILAGDSFHEADLDFDTFHTPSSAFMEVVESVMHDSIIGLNASARSAFERHTQNRPEPETHHLTNIEQIVLMRAVQFCKAIGFDVDSYQIKVVKSLGPHGIGMAANGNIYIAQRAFTVGTKYVASTLIEEFLHLKHGFGDLTREMQNHLFDLIVSMGEQVRGEPL